MFSKKLEDQFSKDLLDAVKGILDEEKKCKKDCECEKCEKEKEDDEDEDEDEKEDMKEGLWANIHAKRARIKRGSGERMRKPGSKGAPTAAALQAAKEEVQLEAKEDEPPFEGGTPVRRHYDKQGNEIKNIAKHLARKSMKKAAGEKVDEAWVVKKGTEVVSTHKSKDEADVKAMKHPLYKVYAKEEVQIDELSVDKLDKYRSAARKDIIDADANDDNRLYNKRVKGYRAASKAVNKKLAKEEAEQIDEISAKTKSEYAKKASDYIMNKAHSMKPDEVKKWNRRQKGMEMLKKEEAEQIDELSKSTLGKYINKAKDQVDAAAWRSGYRSAKPNDPASDAVIKAKEKQLTKRHKGISKAVDKLTKEETDINEAFSLTEAGRGRPKKYEIHPGTKEKLHYDNPEHMKKIEFLRKRGVLAKPKTEPGEHIINQLRKAAVSMTPHHVKFRNGQKHPISNTHAQRALDKYAGLKPAEKETYQDEIGRSHEDFKKNI